MLNKLLIISVGIALLVTLVAFVVIFNELKEVKQKLWGLDEVKYGNLERKAQTNRNLIESLAEKANAKVAPVGLFELGIVALTEAEKTAKKLRQQADELEREQNG